LSPALVSILAASSTAQSLRPNDFHAWREDCDELTLALAPGAGENSDSNMGSRATTAAAAGGGGSRGGSRLGTPATRANAFTPAGGLAANNGGGGGGDNLSVSLASSTDGGGGVTAHGGGSGGAVAAAAAAVGLSVAELKQQLGPGVLPGAALAAGLLGVENGGVGGGGGEDGSGAGCGGVGGSGGGGGL
jgi:hypothetical protein